MIGVEYIPSDHPAYQPDCKVGDSFCYDKCRNQCKEFLEYLEKEEESKNAEPRKQ